jgi:hypothetical protein
MRGVTKADVVMTNARLRAAGIRLRKAAVAEIMIKAQWNIG